MCSADDGWASFTPDSTVITGTKGTVVTVVEVDGGTHAIGSGKVTLPDAYKSKNLLKYGPYSGGNCTVSVESDGKLNMTVKKGGDGAKWNLGTLKAGNYTLSATNTIGNGSMYAYVKNINNVELASIRFVNGECVKSFTLSKATECVFILKNWGDNTITSGYLQLEAGSSATSWVKPDVTDSNGVGI